MSENAYGTIQNGQSRETGTPDGDKQKHNIIYVLWFILVLVHFEIFIYNVLYKLYCFWMDRLIIV